MSFRHPHPQVTEEDVQQLILDRTGVEVSLDNIDITRHDGGDARGVIVSLQNHHVRDLLAWALTDDRLCGRPIELAVPERKR